MTIALLYAFDQEIKPLLRARPADVVFWKTGMGIAAAHEATERLLEQHRPALILSVGYAGATAPQLQTGDLVLPTEVRSEAGDVLRPDQSSREALRGENSSTLHEGPLLTVWKPLKTPAEKEMAGSRGVIACDMETAAIAAVAIKANIPWASLRVIFDPMHEELQTSSLFKIPKMFRWHRICQKQLTQSLQQCLIQL